MLGEVINNYEIKSLLGEGGMGAVYLAEHPFIGRRAAIKVLRRELAQDLSLVERFMNEARAANAIRHPNIIDIIDVGRTPSGVPYLMMELLEGTSLAERISDVGQLEVAEALEIGAQTCGALAAAHAKGIVHRDLKPDNLFLIADDARPGSTKVKVLDFGIAKLRGDLTNPSKRTQAGALMGTPPYMSPEQCRGLTDDIDHRTDVYAMGIILYEMLCGAPPFVSEGWGEIVLAHLSKPPPRPRATNPRMSEDVEAAILRALAKEKDERFASMTELQAALRAAAAAAPATGAARPWSPTAAQERTRLIPPTPPTTTFRTAVGEVTPTDEPRAPRRRGGLWLAVATAGVAAIIAVAVTRGTPVSTDIVASAPVALPAAKTLEPAAPPAPAPAAVEQPPAPAQIRLQIVSEPAGASVVDTRDAALLGETPLDRRIERAAAPLSLRIAKPGFTTAELRVPRDADFEATVRLEHQRPRVPVARRSPSGDAPPPKSALPAPAAGPPPAPPAAEPQAPPPARRVEKW